MSINKVYLADCMEVMKKMKDKSVDLCIVDPPYGGSDAIGLKDNKKTRKQATNRTDYKIFKNIEPSKEYWQELIRISKNQIIWGCNFYTNINLHGGRLVWDKKGTAFGRAEEAYLSMTKSVNIFEYTWNGMLQQNMGRKEIRIHPAQKPVDLYKFLLENYAHKGDKIFDSHVGSGSSRIACYDLGYDFEGCEIDKDYWQDQEDRFNKHISQLSLFTPEELEPEYNQTDLF